MKMPKILSLRNLLILIVVLVLGYALYNYSCSKMFSMEGIEDGQTESPKEEAAVTKFIVSRSLKSYLFSKG